ncbi:hypothetical protein [Nocardioides nitrophenolicus]|uniref:hypothetical protein n=1 Tax=Nocardioides nitrophenolicus TaxID=60489 RepID=UPI0019615805|nr:hypothetical protein [Nocardioides nitrophenolicus]MBM7520502.1 hypothetical protein [Nocardioides nitrophenolicus]
MTAAAVLAVLGIVPAPPAIAASQTVVVAGYAFPAGLRYVAGGCTGTGTATPYAAYRAGSVLGDHAIGLAFGGHPGGMGGVSAWVSDPGDLLDAALATYHPSPLPGTPGVDGHITIAFDAFGNGFQTSWLVGRYDVSNLTGWHLGDDVADIATDWYWSDDSTQEYAGWTLPEVAGDWGPGSGGAWLDFEFGCRGRDFFFDDLRLRTSAGTTTYDFEGVPSQAYISAAPTHHSAALERGITRLDLVKGQDHYLLADAKTPGDGVWSPGYVPGTATLWARPWGAPGFSPVASGGFGTDSYAQFHVQPDRQTEYQVRTSGDDTFEASASATLLVTVARQVNARAPATRVRQGQPIRVRGRIAPGDAGVRVSLQRKVGKHWRTVDRARTRAGGRFALRVDANRVGRWTVRVSVAAAKGNGASVTPGTRIRVVPRPQPQPQPAPAPVYVPVPVTHVPAEEPKGTVPPSAHHRLRPSQRLS